MVLHQVVNLQDLIDNGNKYFPDMIKFCIDIKRRVVCVDEEMHIEMEHMLFDDGSNYEDIYGGNIVFESDAIEIVWEAHPNIERNKELGGRGRLLTDANIINELTEILYDWVK